MFYEIFTNKASYKKKLNQIQYIYTPLFLECFNIVEEN